MNSSDSSNSAKFQHEKAFIEYMHVRLVKFGRSSLSIPAFLGYTHQGAIPNLTGETFLEECGTTAGILFSVDELEMRLGKGFVNAYGHGLHKFVCIPDEIPLLITPRDIASTYSDLACTKNFVTTSTSGGRRQVTPEIYMEMVNGAESDAWLSLSDYIPIGDTSGKRRSNAVQRSLTLLDSCMSQTNEETRKNIFGVIQCSNDATTRNISIVETVKRGVCGFVLCGIDACPHSDCEQWISTLSSIVKMLPPDGIKLFFGADDPITVLHGIECKVDLFTGKYPHDVTDRGHALIFPHLSTVSEVPGTTDTDSSDDEIASKRLKSETDHNYYIDMKDICYAKDKSVLLDGCGCFACKNGHSRAYIHHLLNTKELLGDILLTRHNLYHYSKFFESVRSVLQQCHSEKEYRGFVDRIVSVWGEGIRLELV